MAYHLCSSPSSLFHNPRTPSRSLPFPSPTNFRLRSSAIHTHRLSFPPLQFQSTTSLQIHRVSLQDQVAEEAQSPKDSEIESLQSPDGNSGSLSKSYVWVNPRSPRASQLRHKSYDSRYASLVKVAEYLNSCAPIESDVSEALKGLGDNILEQDAVVVLNNMNNPENALLALNYFHKRLKPKREVILYNVTLKVCRKGKDLDRAEKLFDQLLQRGVKPDNVTFSTMISCARMCSLPDKAVEWFEKMPSFGCNPGESVRSSAGPSPPPPPPRVARLHQRRLENEDDPKAKKKSTFSRSSFPLSPPPGVVIIHQHQRVKGYTLKCSYPILKVPFADEY